MVVAPTSTIDLNVADGESIAIEERAESEVLELFGRPVAATGARAWNPVFDITPAGLVTTLVTERGRVEAPDKDKIVQLFDL